MEPTVLTMDVLQFISDLLFRVGLLAVAAWGIARFTRTDRH